MVLTQRICISECGKLRSPGTQKTVSKTKHFLFSSGNFDSDLL